MANSSKGWYYMGYEWRGRSIVYGPFTAEEIRDAFKKGDIDEKTQVRYGLNSPWLPLKDVAFFSRLVSRPRLTFDKQEFLKRHKTWVLIIAIVLFTFVYSRLHTPHHAPVTSALSTSVPYQEVLDQNTIINLTNKARALNGLSHLNENPLLNTIAEKRAEDMFEKQYFDHVSPFGEKASDIAQRVGYRYKTIGENIASGRFVTNQKVIDGWMQSPGHRKNILSTDVEDLGAAIIKGNMHGEETCIAVQIFGLQSTSLSGSRFTSARSGSWAVSRQSSCPTIPAPGVTRPCRYEPDLNPAYHDMATHYGTVVIHARVKKPKDKAKVKSAVLIAQRVTPHIILSNTPSFFSQSFV